LATPSSSPPTTPISISRTMFAAAHFSSSSSAICRFSSSGDRGAVPHVRLEQRLLAAGHPLGEIAMSGRTKPSSLSLGQWSVCSAMLTG
jgi:hypothetical protein